jgi:hypothetical protein
MRMNHGLLCLAAAAQFALAQQPTVDSVMERSIEASGGRAAYEGLKTQVIKAKMTFVGQPIEGKLTLTMEHPGKSATVVDLGEFGQVRSGISHGVAWEISPMQGGPRLLDGAEKALTMRMSQLDAPLRWKEIYPVVKLAGEESVDGSACWRVDLTPKEGKPESQWFDKQSGLLSKWSVLLPTPMGEVPIEYKFSDYRKVGSLMMPYKLVQSIGPQSINTVMDEVQVNVPVPPETFNLPKEIEALVTQKK